jgi:hypothetical protein
MRTSHILLSACALTLCVAAVGFVAAEETRGPVPQRLIAQPFLDGLVGSWTTESTMVHDGKESKGTGKSTYSRGIGGTALLQDYELTGPGPDGKTMSFYGHGVTKLADDGKTVTTWWFCNMSPDVMKLVGTVSDTGLELSGESPHGGHVTISFTKTPDGLTFKMNEGPNQMTDLYKRAR